MNSLLLLFVQQQQFGNTALLLLCFDVVNNGIRENVLALELVYFTASLRAVYVVIQNRLFVHKRIELIHFQQVTDEDRRIKVNSGDSLYDEVQCWNITALAGKHRVQNVI